MTILQAADALAAKHPDRMQRKTGWPCCELVGRVGLLAAGLSAPPHGSWWAGQCIHDPADPWSPLWSTRALVEVATGMDLEWPSYLVTPDGAPWGEQHVQAVIDRLPPVGIWSVFQRWKTTPGPGRTGSGHQVLGRHDGDGVVFVLESSIAGGMKLGGVLWHEGERPATGGDDLRPFLRESRAGVAVIPLWEGA